MGKAQKSPLLEQLSKLKPQQILAVGAALLMIALGIAIIILAMTQLLKALKGMTGPEMIAAIVILVVVFGGMALMMLLLAGAASAAAGPLIAVGVAMLLIGISIAIVILSMVLLLNTIKGMTGPELIAGIIMLIVILGSMVAIIALLGVVGTAAGPGILMVGAALLMIGAGIFLIGLAIAIILDAFGKFITQIMQSSSSFGTLMTIVSSMIPLILVLTQVFVMLGLGLITASLGIGAFALGMLVLVTLIPMFLMINFAVGGLADNIYKLGLGIKYIAENLAAATNLLVQFSAAMAQLQVSKFGQQMADQIFLMVKALIALTALSPVLLLTIALLPALGAATAPESKGTTGEEGGSQVVTELQTANQYLASIGDNTKRSTELMEKLLGKTSSAARAPMNFNFGK